MVPAFSAHTCSEDAPSKAAAKSRGEASEESLLQQGYLGTSCCEYTLRSYKHPRLKTISKSRSGDTEVNDRWHLAMGEFRRSQTYIPVSERRLKPYVKETCDA